MPPLAALTMSLFLAAPTTAPAAVYEDEDGRVELDRDRLVEFVLETRGLDALLNLMQLRLAEEQARRRGIEVGPEAVEAEVRRTLDEAFAGVEGVSPEDYPALLDQLLAQRQLSRAEFDVIASTNAHLRALAAPAVREAVDEAALRRAFNARYGEQAVVRLVAAEDLANVADARARVDAGEDFEAVARDVNRDPGLRRTGGLIDPFTRQSDMPEPFKEAAFALAVGEVSPAVAAADRYFLIRLEELRPPRAVKFEAVRDELREQVIAEQVAALVPELRRRLAAALATDRLTIENPALAAQLRARLASLEPQPTDAETIRDRMERERDDAPATRPAAPRASGIARPDGP